jgi:hypothetical protein
VFEEKTFNLPNQILAIFFFKMPNLYQHSNLRNRIEFIQRSFTGWEKAYKLYVKGTSQQKINCCHHLVFDVLLQVLFSVKSSLISELKQQNAP